MPQSPDNVTFSFDWEKEKEGGMGNEIGRGVSRILVCNGWKF